MKRSLLKRPNFDLQKAFDILNMDGQESGFDKISIEEVQGILKRHGLITFPRQVGPFFNRFDKDKDGMVGFQDFKLEIEPIEAPSSDYRKQFGIGGLYRK
jgi:Ca2+-binding EF-hand superfamily protein